MASTPLPSARTQRLILISHSPIYAKSNLHFAKGSNCYLWQGDSRGERLVLGRFG